MFIIRNVFKCKPGKAKDVVAKFKSVQPLMVEAGITTGGRVLTDISASFWTVVVESEVPDLNKFLDALANLGNNAQFRDKMKGYMELVEGGEREIWKVE